MSCMKSVRALGRIRSPLLLAGLLSCLAGDTRGQCPPDLVPYSASEEYESASAYQSCYSSRYRSQSPPARSGGLLRRGTRLRAVSRYRAVGTMPPASPRVVYASPTSSSYQSTGTYSSYSSMTSAPVCTGACSSAPSVGAFTSAGRSRVITSSVGYGVTSWSSYPVYSLRE